MKLLLFSKYGDWSLVIDLAKRQLSSLLFSGVLVVMLTAFIGGYLYGQAHQTSDERVSSFADKLAIERAQIEWASGDVLQGIGELTLRMGRIQAQIIQLNARGQRLNQTAALEGDSFSFFKPPAQGGPAPLDDGVGMQASDLLHELERLEAQVDRRRLQLDLYEAALRYRDITGGAEATASLAALYPATGLMDLEADGSVVAEIAAVAPGVVTFSGERPGSGTLIEIDHGGGYVTRYASNRHHLVATGDRVQRGQVIALRSAISGEQIRYFQVLHNGRAIDPLELTRRPR